MRYNKIPFGLRNNLLVTINDLKEDEAGINCNCICPQCKKPLIAVFSEKQKNHFRHKMYENHCYFNINNFIPEFIWQQLNESVYPEILNISKETMKYLKIHLKNKELKKRIEAKKILQYKVSNINHKNNTFTFIIEDNEFIVKLYFDKKNIPVSQYNFHININDLIKDYEKLDELKNIIFEECLKKSVSYLNNKYENSSLIHQPFNSKKELENALCPYGYKIKIPPDFKKEKDCTGCSHLAEEKCLYPYKFRYINGKWIRAENKKSE